MSEMDHVKPSAKWEAQRRYRERHRERLKKYNAAKAKEYRAKNPEKFREAKRRWQLAGGEKYRNQHLNRKRKVPGLYAMQAAKARAKNRGVPFFLTPEWVAANYTGYCAVTGIEFSHAGDGIRSRVSGPFAPSIDRIDPLQGYTQENCRFVIWAFNRFKGADTDEVVFEIARIIADKATRPTPQMTT